MQKSRQTCAKIGTLTTVTLASTLCTVAAGTPFRTSAVTMHWHVQAPRLRRLCGLPQMCTAGDRLHARKALSSSVQNPPGRRLLTLSSRSGCWLWCRLCRSLQRLPVPGQCATASLICTLPNHCLPIITCEHTGRSCHFAKQ